MKKALLGSVATGALIAAAGSSANAADLGARPIMKAAPMVAPVPVFSWTGCYVGAHGGWGWGKNDITQDTAFHHFSAGTLRFFSSATFKKHSAGSIDTSGALFGGQIGCDYQFAGNFVLGIQGMFAGTGMSGSTIDPNDPSDPFDVLHMKTEWISDVTGRLGVTGWLPQTLLYVKGGVAWVRDKFDFRDADTFAASHIFDQTRTGWTVGVGLEYAIAPNWSIFAEYDHYDFGTKNVVNATSSSFFCGFVGFGAPQFCADSSHLDVKQRIETVKVGVNWRFNWGKAAAPVQARY